MDEVVFLLGVVVLVVLVLPIWALVAALGARRRAFDLALRLDAAETRVVVLETALERLTTRPGAAVPELPAGRAADPVLRDAAPLAEADADPVEADPIAPADLPSVLPRVRRARPDPEMPPPPPAPGWADRLFPWLRENWIYPAAAAFLLLAGVYLVQYSIEMGLLSPAVRLAMALALGAALVAAGEFIRRRAALSDLFGSFAAHLPSTFAGAGVVVIYAAIAAAHLLYGLVPASVAFVGMAVATLFAMGLGWVYGPLLAGLGVVGGTATPFLLGSGGLPPPWIFAYFGFVLALGLGVDAYRRWRWVTVLALALPLGAAVLMRLAGGDALAFALLLVLAAALAMTLPGGALRPQLAGGGLIERRGAAGFAVLVSAGAVAAASLGLMLLVPGWAGAWGQVALIILLAIWARPAPALADQAVLPVFGLLGWTVLQELSFGPVLEMFRQPLPPEAAMPLEASLLLAYTLVAAAAMLWRSDRETGFPAQAWAVGGVALPGAVMVALELFWAPADMIGAYPWALHALALAALTTAQALRALRLDGTRSLRVGVAVSASFALIALGLMLVLSLAALTVALAVLMVAGAAMDRRFDLPHLGWFLMAASMALAWRFVIDPGVFWIMGDTPDDAATLPEVLLTLASVLGAPALALWLIRPRDETAPRRMTRVFLETALAGMVAVAVPVVILRLLPFDLSAHASVGLHATVFLALAWVQLERARRIEGARWLRLGLGGAYGVVALGLVLVGLFVVNPLQGGFLSSRVQGPAIVNDLLPAYAFPGLALVVLFGARRWALAVGLALLGFWAALAIRHYWQGPSTMDARFGILQPELYSYTVAILLAGAGALMRALQTGQAHWRKIGMGLVALATVKAFAVDAAGLAGLLRVFGFLAMGLALAGLAWVNRWVMAREAGAAPPPE